MLGGDLYPSTAIGINLPNSNWIRKQHGSKSVTIGNLTDAYNKAAHGNGFNAESPRYSSAFAQTSAYSSRYVRHRCPYFSAG